MPTPLEQSLAAKFHAAKATFVSGWMIGTDIWVREKEPGMYVKMLLAEQNMEQVWEQAKSNEALVPFFEAALGAWKQAHEDAIAAWKARRVQ